MQLMLLSRGNKSTQGKIQRVDALFKMRDVQIGCISCFIICVVLLHCVGN